MLTQYKSHSLDRHISQTWRFSTLLGNYVTPVPAQMRRGPQWFSGSADAIYQNLNLISDERPDIVCVFGADHIYHMDPRQMVEHHMAVGAGVTVAAIPVAAHDGFAVRHHRGVAPNGKIIDFHEKPADPPTMPGDPSRALASMGNYVFDTQTLIDVVSPTGTDEIATDIGGDVIPMLTRSGVAHMYDFSTNVIPGQAEHERGYWRDVGSLDAYYEANMDLIAPVPPFSLYNGEWPMYSLQLPLPPAKIDHGPGGERPSHRQQPAVRRIDRVGWNRRALDPRPGDIRRCVSCRQRVDPVPRCPRRAGRAAASVCDRQERRDPRRPRDRSRRRGRPQPSSRSAIGESSWSRRTAASADAIGAPHGSVHAGQRGDADAQSGTGQHEFDDREPAHSVEIAGADGTADRRDAIPRYGQ